MCKKGHCLLGALARSPLHTLAGMSVTPSFHIFFVFWTYNYMDCMSVSQIAMFINKTLVDKSW